MAGVVALQAALQLAWIVYRAYQPELLRAHGFAGWLLPLALLPGFLGLLIEPLSGALSDRWSRRGRGRLLPITLAVAAAGLIFLAVVGLLQAGIPASQLWLSSGLLPVLMVLWVLAVQASASPNLAQLNEAISLRELPRAAALLTLVQGLIGASAAALAAGALRLGPAFTFLLGALVLGLGWGVLRAAQPRRLSAPWRGAPFALGPARTPAAPQPPALESPPQAAAASAPRARPPLLPALLLLLTALAVGGLQQVLLEGLPQRLGPSTLAVVPVLLLSSALAAPWTGRLVVRWGQRRALVGSVAALAGLLALALLLPARLAPPLLLPLLGLLGVVHSAVATSLTAAALATLPAAWSGLGAGLVFGGSGLAASLVLLRFGSQGLAGAPAALTVLAPSAALALAGALRLALRSPLSERVQQG